MVDTITDSVATVVTVYFEFDEYQLAEDQLEEINNLVLKPLTANHEMYVIVNGYADSQGSKVYNYALSQERAHLIQQYIIKSGISEERVLAYYFGESQLTKICPDEECDESVHQANRRAELMMMIKAK